jgi:ribosomal protein L32
VSYKSTQREGGKSILDAVHFGGPKLLSSLNGSNMNKVPLAVLVSGRPMSYCFCVDTAVHKKLPLQVKNVLFGSLYFASPKRKTTPSKRRIKQRLKRFVSSQHVEPCPYCGRGKKLHQICVCQTKQKSSQ